jgi:uncharacterized spore protein YtfJ
MNREIEQADGGRRPESTSLAERIVRQVGVTSSVGSVYGEPVDAHGHTVIPVARVYFMYGAGMGPELGGRMVDRPPDGRVAPSLSSGGGGGGLGIARPAGYIEIGPEGTRFVPATRDWRGTLAVALTIALTLLVLRPPWPIGRGR